MGPVCWVFLFRSTWYICPAGCATQIIEAPCELYFIYQYTITILKIVKFILKTEYFKYFLVFFFILCQPTNIVILWDLHIFPFVKGLLKFYNLLQDLNLKLIYYETKKICIMYNCMLGNG